MFKAASLGFLLAACALGTAEAGVYREFNKWSVGCDNALNCTAYGISAEEFGDDLVGLRITRAAGNDGKIEVVLGKTDLSISTAVYVDGTLLAKESPAKGVTHPAPNDRAIGLIGKLLNGRTLALTDKPAKSEVISLEGMKAALLFMDDKQGRVGSANAFVAKGDKKSGNKVPSPRQYPTIRAARIPAKASKATTDLPKPIADTVLAHYRKTADKETCDLGMDKADREEPTGYDLGGSLLLVEIYCWRAAYQAGSVFYLYDTRAKTLRDAPFELPDTKTGALSVGRNSSVTSPDVEAGAIGSLHKSRGVGGCGEWRSWQWDGTAFRLVSHVYKDHCGYANAAIRLYRANVKNPDGTMKVEDSSDDDGVF